MKREEIRCKSCHITKEEDSTIKERNFNHSAIYSHEYEESEEDFKDLDILCDSCSVSIYGRI